MKRSNKRDKRDISREVKEATETSKKIIEGVVIMTIVDRIGGSMKKKSRWKKKLNSKTSYFPKQVRTSLNS